MSTQMENNQQKKKMTRAKKVCAFTKFKKVVDVYSSGKVKFTQKAVERIQRMTDDIMKKIFKYLYEYVVPMRKTIKGVDLVFIMKILNLTGTNWCNVSPTVIKLLPKRIGFHLVNASETKIRISKDSQEMIQKLYISIVAMIIEIILSESSSEKRMSPDAIKKVLQESKLKEYIK